MSGALRRKGHALSQDCQRINEGQKGRGAQGLKESMTLKISSKGDTMKLELERGLGLVFFQLISFEQQELQMGKLVTMMIARTSSGLVCRCCTDTIVLERFLKHVE